MSSLENQVALGLHLSAGASDGYITSAEYILDEKKVQTVQESLNALFSAVGSTTHGAITNIAVNAAGTELTVTFADNTTAKLTVRGNEVEVGEDTPTDTNVEIFIDTADDSDLDVYTKDQIDTMITAITSEEVKELWQS